MISSKECVGRASILGPILAFMASRSTVGDDDDSDENRDYEDTLDTKSESESDSDSESESDGDEPEVENDRARGRVTNREVQEDTAQEELEDPLQLIPRDGDLVKNVKTVDLPPQQEDDINPSEDDQDDDDPDDIPVEENDSDDDDEFSSDDETETVISPSKTRSGTRFGVSACISGADWRTIVRSVFRGSTV
eukprot:scaffold22605_cov192-Cylindrotheca_fusiformis.AAC.3